MLVSVKVIHIISSFCFSYGNIDPYYRISNLCTSVCSLTLNLRVPVYLGTIWMSVWTCIVIKTILPYLAFCLFIDELAICCMLDFQKPSVWLLAVSTAGNINVLDAWLAFLVVVVVAMSNLPAIPLWFVLLLLHCVMICYHYCYCY